MYINICTNKVTRISRTTWRPEVHPSLVKDREGTRRSSSRARVRGCSYRQRTTIRESSRLVTQSLLYSGRLENQFINAYLLVMDAYMYIKQEVTECLELICIAKLTLSFQVVKCFISFCMMLYHLQLLPTDTALMKAASDVL